MRVKNLFYNVPARRKFLKTDQTELRNLITEYQRIVLVNPQVQFTFVSNDEILSELPVCTQKQRIEAVFGHSSKPYTGNLVDIATETELVRISGFIGKPETAGKNSQQYMFVNGRYMRHPYFHKALMTAYSGMLLHEHAPSYFLYFDIHPDAIDVNIHPTKTEIKFADEQAIFQILLAATKEALGKFNVAPSLDFTCDSHLDIPPQIVGTSKISAPRIELDPNYNPFKAQPSRAVSSSWEKLNEHVNTPNRTSLIQPESLSHDTLFDIPIVVENAPLIQWDNSYIVAPMPAGLMVIHQHRAHVCVLYKVLLEQLNNKQAATQPLLFPEILELSQDDFDTLEQLLPEFHSVGFELEQFSPIAYSINAIPALLGQKCASNTLLQVIHKVQDTERSASQQWQEMIALSLAEQMAIPQGKSLTDVEIRDLVDRLQQASSSRHLPNGQTISFILTHEDIQKRF
jgi:DNA mismatch repair protein MutL